MRYTMEMIELKDGKLITPFDERDIFEAIEEYAGWDLRRYFEEYISEELSECEDCKKECKRLENDLEKESDYWYNAMYEIKEEVEALLKLLDADRLNRDKLRKAADSVYRLADNF